jgi:hypothetical protein
MMKWGGAPGSTELASGMSCDLVSAMGRIASPELHSVNRGSVRSTLGAWHGRLARKPVSGVVGRQAGRLSHGVAACRCLGVFCVEGRGFLLPKKRPPRAAGWQVWWSLGFSCSLGFWGFFCCFGFWGCLWGCPGGLCGRGFWVCLVGDLVFVFWDEGGGCH